jgi:tRNA(Ile)-lysidine synthase
MKKLLLTKKIHTMTVWNRITSFIREKNLFPEKATLLLAVSGGPDSVMLLDYFARNAKKRKLRLVIAHVNHNLRGKASDADARFTERLGKAYGIETEILSANVKEIAEKEGGGIESAARKARYALLLKTALEKKCAFIVTAHHSDDNAETILLNMLRGTDPKGLAGIPVSRTLYRSGRKTVRLIRPLLSVSRKEIEQYLILNGLKSRKDHTNDDDRYTRNWIRTRLLPLLEKKQPRIREHLVMLSEGMTELFK